MENITNVAPVSVPTASQGAAPMNTASSIPTPPPAPLPVMQTGGVAGGGGVKGFFNSLNWIEVGFMILGSVALYQMISYYRNKLKQDRVARDEQQRQIDEVKMNVQTAMKGKYKAI